MDTKLNNVSIIDYKKRAANAALFYNIHHFNYKMICS